MCRPMAEDRRLKIAKRQLMLAQIARREARYSLANALAEEERSANIHERSRTLLHEYARRIHTHETPTAGQSLHSNLAFLRSLQTMSDSAQAAHKDASDQSQWEMQRLAMAETKMDAHKSKVDEEERAMSQLRMRRDVPPELTGAAGLARKLQNHPQTDEQAASQPAHATQPSNRAPTR